MSSVSSRGVRRVLTLGTALAVAATPAAAVHQPVVLDSRDVLPWLAPLSLDGTDEVVFLGVLPRAGAVRSLQFRMRAGEPLNVELFVPDLAPENALAAADLPRALLVDPAGRITVLDPNLRFPFTNPDNGQRYLVLRTHEATAVAGTYSVLVLGQAPARFALAHGREGAAATFDGIRRGSVASAARVDRWYATAP